MKKLANFLLESSSTFPLATISLHGKYDRLKTEMILRLNWAGRIATVTLVQVGLRKLRRILPRAVEPAKKQDLAFDCISKVKAAEKFLLVPYSYVVFFVLLIPKASCSAFSIEQQG